MRIKTQVHQDVLDWLSDDKNENVRSFVAQAFFPETKIDRDTGFIECFGDRDKAITTLYNDIRKTTSAEPKTLRSQGSILFYANKEELREIINANYAQSLWLGM